MKAIVKPINIEGGNTTIPTSKSITQRACTAALLNKGTTIISFWDTLSADEEAALNIIQQLGATVDKTHQIVIESEGLLSPIDNTINCGESGLATRLFIPIAALSANKITITGKGSLLTRPMDTILGILPQLGVQVSSNNGKLPITLQGALQPKDITIDGSLSSQFLSGLLFAFAFTTKQPVSIVVTNLKSKPYIDLTLQTLKQFGAVISHDDYKEFHIGIRETTIDIIHIPNEADWSSAAPLLVAGAITGSITVSILNHKSLQADSAIIEVLRQVGATIDITSTQTTVSKPYTLQAFSFDATDCPDLFPILATLASCCNGTSSIKGLHRLMHKESNRAESIAAMLTALNVHFSIDDDTLTIIGKEKLSSCTIDAYNDHRIVMAAAIAGLKTNDGITLTGAEAINKSFPIFFDSLSSLGVAIQLIDDE